MSEPRGSDRIVFSLVLRLSRFVALRLAVSSKGLTAVGPASVCTPCGGEVLHSYSLLRTAPRVRGTLCELSAV